MDNRCPFCLIEALDGYCCQCDTEFDTDELVWDGDIDPFWVDALIPHCEGIDIETEGYYA